MEAKQLKTVNGCPTCWHSAPESPISFLTLLSLAIVGLVCAVLGWLFGKKRELR